MSYKTLGYDLAHRIFANIDKCSANGHGKRVRSPWGTFTLYRSGAGGRFFSLSGSAVFHNGGSYRIGSLRTRLFGL